MKIKGSYTFNIPLQGMFLNKIIKITHNNIITLLGESFFLNRAINEEFTPIQYICIGNSSNLPRKNDLKLGNETLRKKCTRIVDLDKRQIVLSANFTAKELLGTTEIGVANDSILISHDVYNKDDIEDLLKPEIGDITIDYFIEISSGAIRNSEWTQATNYENIFYIIETNTVVGVIEDNTLSGYRRVKNIDEVANVKGSYYHDTDTHNLYVHTTNDSNPENEEIIIQTR